MKNTPAIMNDKTEATNKSNKFCGLRNTGEMTPAENQATAKFPNISDDLSICLFESLIRIIIISIL